MLGRYGKMLRRRLRAQVTLLQQLRLLDHLAGIPQKLRAFLGQRDALVRALENRDPDFFLQIADGVRQARLGNEQPLGSLVHGASARHLDHIF
ncbi:hypothetical protein D3C71_1686360 [compost metagenome]